MFIPPRRGGGAGGDRPAAGYRPPPGALPPSAVRRDRLRDGWEGPAGKVARGGRRHPWAPNHPAPSVTAPRQQRSPNPGAEGTGYPSPRSPLPSPPSGVEGGGRAAPPTARPLSHLPPSSGVPGSGRTVLSAPRASSRRRAGGVRRSRRSLRSGAERTGSAAMSATHPTRLETRTKESNACASQGLVRKPPWRNEGERGPPRGPEVGSRGLSQSAEGAPPARLARRAGEVEHERTR